MEGFDATLNSTRQTLVWSDEMDPFTISMLVINTIACIIIVMAAIFIWTYQLGKSDINKTVLDKFTMFWLRANGLLAFFKMIAGAIAYSAKILGFSLVAIISGLYLMLTYQLALSTLAFGIVQYSLVFPDSNVCAWTDRVAEHKQPIVFSSFYWFTGILIYCLVLETMMDEGINSVMSFIVAALVVVCFVASLTSYIILRLKINSSQDPGSEETHVLGSRPMMFGLMGYNGMLVILLVGRGIARYGFEDEATANKWMKLGLTLSSVVHMFIFIGFILTSSKLKAHARKHLPCFKSSGQVNPLPSVTVNLPQEAVELHV